MNRVLYILLGLVFIIPGYIHAFTLSNIQHKYASYKDFTVEFNQVTYQRLKEGEIHFEGKVLYKKPGHVRMDVYKPQRQIIILKENQISIYLPEEDELSIQEIPEEIASQNILAFMAGLDTIEKDYEVQIKDDHLLLTPKKGKGSIMVWVGSNYLINRIEATDFIGNHIKLELHNYLFDQGLSDEIFSIKH
ncbi:MAG: outer membrane lipoprotein carrier protein LolA [Deltaproteobacteria bacterium]|nr:outer membrane lipoprotein carrier protein LolA [Deltaproteobacteria bacterium]